MKVIDTAFGKVVVSDSIPEGTILLVPPLTWVRRKIAATGEVKEWLEFDPKAAGVITNVHP